MAQTKDIQVGQIIELADSKNDRNHEFHHVRKVASKGKRKKTNTRSTRYAARIANPEEASKVVSRLIFIIVILPILAYISLFGLATFKNGIATLNEGKTILPIWLFITKEIILFVSFFISLTVAMTFVLCYTLCTITIVHNLKSVESGLTNNLLSFEVGHKGRVNFFFFFFAYFPSLSTWILALTSSSFFFFHLSPYILKRKQENS